MIRLYTLGILDLRAAGGRTFVSVLSQPKRTALLAYLAMAASDHFHRRDTVLALFWPELDQKRARHALRQSLYVLRRTLGKGVLLARGGEELSVNGEVFWCDAVAFDRRLDEGRLAEALELYGGDLFTGFHVSDVSPEFEDWVEVERVRLRGRAFEAARRLAREREAAGNLREAVSWTRRALALSPHDEEVLGSLLLLLDRAGHSAAALRVHDEFARRIARDLGLDPSSEIRSIIADVRSRARRPGGQGLPEEPRGATGEAAAVRPRPPHNVPAQPTPLLGRTEEIRIARTLLQDESVRLLTLTGPGGTGKTRLALHLAGEWVEAWEHGVWFVSLAPVRDPAVVASTIVHALGLRDESRRVPFETLRDFMGERRLLLVLDNFEHLLPAAGLISDLLAAAPGLQVLVTSRARLRLRGEHELPVPPLEVPAEAGLPVAALLRYPAVGLFVQRARAADVRFRLMADNAHAVVEICRRLDGLPLALELAAARLRNDSPQQLLERLESRLPALTDGPTDAPGRQRTLRDTIAWSNDLLDRPHRALFRRLSVFAGGFTPDAAETVCGGSAEAGLDGIRSLASVSLLVTAHQGDESLRFSMLETIREYAAELLAASGEEEDLRRRHAAYQLALAETTEPGLLGSEQPLMLELLEREHDNLRVALRWGLDRDLETAARIGIAIWRFWWVHGHLTEGREWLERMLAQSAALEPRLRARLLNTAGGLAFRQGDEARARARYEEALSVARVAGDTREIARALRLLGAICGTHGEGARGIELLDQARAIDQQLGDKRGLTDSLGALSGVLFHQGDYDHARALCEQSLELLKELGDGHGQAMVMNNMADIARHQDELDQATRFVEEGLTLARELEGRYVEAALLATLGDVLRAKGEHAGARAAYLSSLGIARALGMQREILLQNVNGLAGLALAEREAERAVTLRAIANALDEPNASRMPPDDVREAAAELAAARAILGEAVFARAWAEGSAMGTDRGIAFALDSAEEISREALEMRRRGAATRRS